MGTAQHAAWLMIAGLGLLGSGCSAEPELDCGERGCQAAPAPAPAAVSCEGDDWVDDGGVDDRLQRAAQLGPIRAGDVVLESDDLYPAGDVDVYSWAITMDSGPLHIGSEILSGPSALERCAVVRVEDSQTSAARCVNGDVRDLGGGLLGCCALAGEPLAVTPDARAAATGELVVQLRSAIGGTCNRYAVEVSTLLP